jgi:opacity protein-like surface antigen
MGRFLVVLGAVLVFSTAAAGQGPVGTGTSSDLTQWQFAVGYQYNRDNLTGSPFNTHGINFSLARFFGSWFGLEGQVGVGFGKTGLSTFPPDLTAKSVFAGVGPRLAYRGHGHVEPWVHGEVGVQHISFSQTAGLLGDNTAFGWVAGGGVDIPVNPHMAIRLEADSQGTRFFSVNQRNFQAIGGLVFNF